MKTLEQGDESALLAEALTVQGLVWARLWEYQSSINVLRRAAELAEGAGGSRAPGWPSSHLSKSTGGRGGCPRMKCMRLM